MPLTWKFFLADGEKIGAQELDFFSQAGDRNNRAGDTEDLLSDLEFPNAVSKLGNANKVFSQQHSSCSITTPGRVPSWIRAVVFQFKERYREQGINLPDSLPFLQC